MIVLKVKAALTSAGRTRHVIIWDLIGGQSSEAMKSCPLC